MPDRQAAIETAAAVLEGRARAWLMSTGAVTLGQVNEYAPKLAREFAGAVIDALTSPRVPCPTCGGQRGWITVEHVRSGEDWDAIEVPHDCPDCKDSTDGMVPDPAGPALIWADTP